MQFLKIGLLSAHLLDKLSKIVIVKAAVENYKGIKFIRISSLPSDQKKDIWKGINHNLVIKILVGDSLLNDCIQYEHYSAWYENSYLASVPAKSIEIDSSVGSLAIAS